MVGGLKNSPGHLMLVPYIIWAIELFVSDLMAALKPSSTVDKNSVHLMLLCAFIALFRILCCLSIFPLLWRWYEKAIGFQPSFSNCRSTEPTAKFDASVQSDKGIPVLGKDRRAASARPRSNVSILTPNDGISVPFAEYNVYLEIWHSPFVFVQGRIETSAPLSTRNWQPVPLSLTNNRDLRPKILAARLTVASTARAGFPAHQNCMVVRICQGSISSQI
ncbi:hypothetical protein NPIL_176411 [Nephila pilipes]|uniref:Uncharacterized protein n=1 Tax=Nephila pilipes TaxID=299642 RepID=A0A8X6PIB6_NEPPI|nr:hypothetical protein NPIL_176411 [Nephila pilipes]